MKRTSLLAQDRACKSFPAASFVNFILLSHVDSEYDFLTFNTVAGGGNVSVTTLVAPTLNGLGPDRPVALAVSIDSLAPQTTYFIPAAPAGSLPPQWDTPDGFVVRTSAGYTGKLSAHMHLSGEQQGSNFRGRT